MLLLITINIVAQSSLFLHNKLQHYNNDGCLLTCLAVVHLHWPSVQFHVSLSILLGLSIGTQRDSLLRGVREQKGSNRLHIYCCVSFCE